MYKVFVNDKPIILTDSLKKENNFSNYLFKNIVLEEVIYKLQKSNRKGINMYSDDLEADWKKFLVSVRDQMTNTYLLKLVLGGSEFTERLSSGLLLSALISPSYRYKVTPKS